MSLQIFTFFVFFAGVHVVPHAAAWSEVITRKCYEEGLNTTTSRRHCFFTPNWGTYWTDAQKWCRVHDGHLAVINNQKIQEFIEEFVTLAGLSHYIWTGGMLRMCVEGDWVWNDESHYREKQLVNSRAGSTNDFRTAVAMTVNDGTVQLIPRNPSDLLPHICQYPGSSTRCTTSTNSYRYKDRCYVLHNGPDKHSWYDARTSCLFDNGDLASFDGHLGLIDSTWLKSMRSNGSVWIGLRNSRWMWHSEDGATEMKYTNFSPDSPRSSEKRCLVLDYKNPWQWTEYYCAAKEPHFICHTAVDGDITTTPHPFERWYYYVDDPFILRGPPMPIGCIVVCLLTLVMIWLLMEIALNTDEIWCNIRGKIIKIFIKPCGIFRRMSKMDNRYTSSGKRLLPETCGPETLPKLVA